MSYYLGIDLGGTRIKIGLSDDYQLIEIQNVKASREKGFQYNMKIIVEAAVGMCSENEISQYDINSIGFAFPGLVNSKAKKVIATNAKYNDAVGFDWDKWAKENFGAAIYLENDARMACIGEWRHGAGVPYTDLIVITLGTGIGTAVVMDNKLLKGKHFQAGNLGGHFSVNYDGRLCTCGNRGCVEAEASTVVLKQLVSNHPDFSTSKLVNLEEISFNNLFELADHDKVALDVRNQCLDIWSAAVISYIHAFDSEAVILVGGIMNSKDVILPYIEEKVNELAWTPWGKVAILSADLNDSAGVIGALHMAQKI
ncbi:ROK family protein [Maribellus luteus]|uniref:ROK family protein n=1 Tax=Maribellus luteus TaxID=2305463 RepID=A0A399T7I8_9BACT|nr:ROK family protein [Maribellus luteus]RIJ50822.1 ROK family protein [Maribellus luteus]